MPIRPIVFSRHSSVVDLDQSILMFVSVTLSHVNDLRQERDDTKKILKPKRLRMKY